MDLLKFQASLDAHTAALLTHSATMEKFMAVAANGGAAASGEAPARGRGRPTNAEKAAQTAASAAPAAATVSVASSPSNATTAAVLGAANAATTQATAAAATAVNQQAAVNTAGPLTHQSLAPKFMTFAKTKGRDAAVALLGEFGAAEFAKIPVEALSLFNDRLDGKPQTPTIAADLGNLLGM